MNLREKLERARNDLLRILLAGKMRRELAERVVRIWWERSIERYFPQERQPDPKLVEEYVGPIIENIRHEFTREVLNYVPVAAPMLLGIFRVSTLSLLVNLANAHGLDVDEIVRALNTHARSRGRMYEDRGYTFNLGRLSYRMFNQKWVGEPQDLGRLSQAFGDEIEAATTKIIKELHDNFQQAAQQIDIMLHAEVEKTKNHIINIYQIGRNMGASTSELTGNFSTIMERTFLHHEQAKSLEEKVVYYVVTRAVDWALKEAYGI